MIRTWQALSLIATTMSLSLFSEARYQETFDENWADGQIADTQEADLFFEIADSNASQQTYQHTQPVKEKSLYPSQSSQGTMFASAQPHLKSNWGGWSVQLSGDWLYWKAQEEGLDYSVQGTDLEVAGTAFVALRGKPHQVSPNYHSGYRLSADVVFPHDVWDAKLIWTRYQNHKSDTTSLIEDLEVWPVYLNSVNLNAAGDEAKAKWKLNFNVLDLELGRSFFIAKHLSLRPFVAFEAAWIEQTLHTKLYDVDALGGFSTSLITGNNHNKFKGYGLRAGVDSKWPVAWGLSLFANLSYSLLSSVFDISQFEKNADHTPRTHLDDTLHVTTQNFQMAGGVNWEMLFYKERLSLNLHVGWEQQVWFDQNQLNMFFSRGNPGSYVGATENQQGNLSLSGWTVGAKLGF